MTIIIIIVIIMITKTWEHYDTVVLAPGCTPPFALFDTSDNDDNTDHYGGNNGEDDHNCVAHDDIYCFTVHTYL